MAAASTTATRPWRRLSIAPLPETRPCATAAASTTASLRGDGYEQHHRRKLFRSRRRPLQLLLGHGAPTDSTVAENTADFAGGIFNDDASGAAIALANTIVADNTAGTAPPDIFGHRDGQLLLDPECSGATINTDFPGSNITGVDPLLDPLANNGGPTETMALTETSPALEAGSNALALDAYGNLLHYRSARRGLSADRQRHRRHGGL